MFYCSQVVVNDISPLTPFKPQLHCTKSIRVPSLPFLKIMAMVMHCRNVIVIIEYFRFSLRY